MFLSVFPFAGSWLFLYYTVLDTTHVNGHIGLTYWRKKKEVELTMSFVIIKKWIKEADQFFHKLLMEI